MKEEINAVLAAFFCCDIDEITPDKCLFTDLYADSLALIGIVSTLSEVFDIEFVDDDFDKITTVRSIHRMVYVKALVS